MAHSRISPSKLPHLAACPGRLQLVETLSPEERNPPPGEAAITGTRRHALIAYRAMNPFRPNPTEIDGEAIWSDDVCAVDKAWSYLKSNPLYLKHKTFLVEHPVEIGAYAGLPMGLVKGTADLIVSNGVCLEVIDWKFGRNPVYPDSLQIKAYGAGAFYRSGVQEETTIRLTIVQPECDPMVKSLPYPVAEVENWLSEISDIAEAALDPNAPRIPNEGCRYCQANLICPERQEGVRQSLSNLFQPVTEEPVPKTTLPPPISVTDEITNLAEAKLTQDTSTLTDGDLGRLLDMEALITGYFKDVKAEALKRAKAGHNPSGWKLIAGRRSREWTVAEEDLPAKLKALRVSAADMWIKKIISPAQAEKLEAISASKQRREKFEELWQWKEGGPQLAPESDPSPEWRAPEKLFAPVAEPEVELPSWY